MRGDQSAPRAHRTGLIIFMTLCHRRGVVQEMRCLLPIDDVTNLRQERESARFNPPRATDNDLSPRDRNISRRLLFRVVLTLLLTATIDDSAN